MRSNFIPRLILAAVFLFQSVSTAAQETSTAMLLSSGSLAVVPDLTITDEALPEDAFLQNPYAIALSREGHVYASDSGANHIKHFDAAGQFLGAIGRKGSGPGDLSSPGYIAAGAGTVCVWEAGNRRFSLFSAAGEFVKTFPLPPDFTRILKVRILPDGRVAILAARDVFADKENFQVGAILIHAPNESSWKTAYERRIKIWNRIDEPVHMSVPLPLNPKICWDVLPDGRLVIGYPETYELEILDLDKDRRTAFNTGYKPVAVTAKDKESHFASMTVAIIGADGSVSRKSGAPDYIVSNTSFPKNKPAFRDIAADDEGAIWVEPYLNDRAEEGKIFDALLPDGTFIRGVRISGDGSFPRYERSSSIIRRTFWRIETGEDGFSKLVRYKIGG